MRRPWPVLLVALLGISAAAPLVRLSGAHPLAIATWRLGFSLIVVAGFLAGTGTWRQWRALSRRDLGTACAAGVMLALHFWSWNASLRLTTVAASVVLVNMHVLIVPLLSAAFLHEAPDSGQRRGIALALAGALVVASADLGIGATQGARALLGDGLALIGALTVALYYIAGRRLRQRLDLWPYVGLVYASCFVVLLALSLALCVPLLSQPPRELAIFAALALGPMMLGHTGLNWALRYLPAYVVNLTVLGEPVGATILAALLPGILERPSPVTLLGGVLILAGMIVAARRPRALEPPSERRTVGARGDDR